MHNLLPDNLALAERLEALPSQLTQLRRPTEQRDIHSILTWVSCFTTYVAIISQVHPERVIDLLAYMRLLIREANKHGGNGWLTYDMVFRRKRQGRNERWDVLDPSIHTAYIAGQESSNRVPCKFCNKVDHFALSCALSPILNTAPQSSSWQEVVSHTSGRLGKRACVKTQGQRKVCLSWNRGQCAYPGACSYLHVCATCCNKDHRTLACGDIPTDSILRKPIIPHKT